MLRPATAASALVTGLTMDEAAGAGDSTTRGVGARGRRCLPGGNIIVVARAPVGSPTAAAALGNIGDAEAKTFLTAQAKATIDRGV